MTYCDSDLILGRQLVRTLVDLRANPPLVKREYQSLGMLHAELSLLGLKLTQKRRYGPEAGYLLVYVKNAIMVKVKTRGERGRYRGGSPHLSVIMLSGDVDKNGDPLTDFGNEIGKFHVGGGLVSKQIERNSPYFNETQNVHGKARQEDWADQTHFAFPDQDLDDSIVTRL